MSFDKNGKILPTIGKILLPYKIAKCRINTVFVHFNILKSIYILYIIFFFIFGFHAHKSFLRTFVSNAITKPFIVNKTR